VTGRKAEGTTLKMTIEGPEKVSAFFSRIEQEKLDDEAYMLRYFRGGLFNFADEAIFAWDDNGTLGASRASHSHDFKCGIILGI
jgi:hypothetical protein